MSAYREPGLALAPAPAPRDRPTLRPYQVAALRAISEAWQRTPSIRRQLIQLPCGAGKTVILADLTRRRLHRGRALILVHRDELAHQTRDKLRDAGIPADQIGTVQGPDDDVDAPVMVASVQTLSRLNRLDRLLAACAAGPGPVETEITDEAHHAAAASYARIREAIHPDLSLGVTATPGRTDRLGLVPQHYDALTYARTRDDLVQDGYLVPLTIETFDLGLDLSAVGLTTNEFGERDFAPEALGRAIDIAQLAPRCIAAWRAHAAGRRTIAYAVRVHYAHQLAEAFRAAGIPSEALDGETPRDARAACLARFRAGETRVLWNVGLFTEGLDVPQADCILLARPTRSPGLLAQMAGRGARPWPGKTDCLLLDGVAAIAEHGQIGYAAIIGRDGTTEPNAPPTGTGVDRQPKIRRVNPRAAMAWISVDDSAWHLSAFDSGYYAVRNARGSWSVWRKTRTRHADGTTTYGAPTCIADNQQEGFAVGLVEDCVRADGLGRKLAPAAAWRSMAPTPGQLSALARFRVTLPPGATRGDANDLLSWHLATRDVGTIRQTWR